jgi:hypothetical protein
MTDELVKYDLNVISAHVLHSLPAGPDPPGVGRCATNRNLVPTRRKPLERIPARRGGPGRARVGRRREGVHRLS